MPKVYILLIKSNTILSKLIGKVTKAEFTHASISFSDDLYPFNSFGRKYTYSVVPAGLKKEYKDKGFLYRNQNIPSAIYEIEVTNEQYRKAKQYVDDMFNSKKRYGFNSIGLFMCKTGIPVRRKRRMFCSEFVASVLKYSDIYNFDNPTLVKPNDFASLENAKCIYKGILKDSFNIKGGNFQCLANQNMVGQL